MSGRGEERPSRTMAAVRRTWRPGWIWAIPIAALLILAWLGIRALLTGGEDVTINFDNVHGLKVENTSVMYRGMPVGQVKAITLAKDGQSVNVTVNIDSRASQFLRAGTRFWLKGANPGFSDLSSLASILSGPSIVMEPGPGKQQDFFVGLSRRPVVPVHHGEPQDYAVLFDGAVGSLKAGDPVTLDGFNVGEVKSVSFEYDAATGKLSTPVKLTLYPSLFHIRNAAQPKSAATLRDAVNRLIAQGLRAQLGRSPPLIGAATVSLVMTKAGPATPAVYDGLPELPVESGGGIDTIVQRVNRIPIEEIGRNVLDITRHVDKVVSSPQLEDSIAQLDSALKQIRKTVAVTGPQISGLIKTLRGTARELDRTAQSVSGTTSQAGIAQTLSEIKDAARAMRELADFLDQHPEALIKGR